MILPLRPQKVGNNHDREVSMPATMHTQSRRDRLARAAVMASACLLASPLCVSPARAIELFQPPTNASLAFSPTSISTNQFENLCAVNYNAAPVTVEFVLKDLSTGFGSFNAV